MVVYNSRQAKYYSIYLKDIIDTGKTMEKLLSIIKPHKPNSVKVASMVIKRTERRKNAYSPDCKFSKRI